MIDQPAMSQVRQITHEGQVWNVLSRGAVRDGKTYCHLTHPLHGRWTKSGFYPLQMADWISNDQIAAIKAVNSYGVNTP